MIVHQVLAGAGPHDAVTTQARRYRERFRAWGWGGVDHATFILPGLDGVVQPRSRLAPAPTDLILLHVSALVPQLERLLAMPNPIAIVYHNVTPARWLWEVAPLLAVQCAVGREQLPALVARASLNIGVSAFNAAELAEAGATDTHVVPLLLEGLGPSAGAPSQQAGAPGSGVLFVGRLSPHKRQDELIRVLALLRAARDPEARLTLVGEPINPGYGEHLAALAGPGVDFERGLSDAELAARYRSAGVFLCLSEHEGFCLPLIEAMRLGVPVVARSMGAVPETVGDAAVLLAPDDGLAVVAEAVHLVGDDAELRAELVRRGHERVKAYDPEPAAATLRALLEGVYSGK